jgi:hypothetical protein
VTKRFNPSLDHKSTNSIEKKKCGACDQPLHLCLLISEGVVNKIIADWYPVGNICEVKVIFEMIVVRIAPALFLGMRPFLDQVSIWIIFEGK